MKKIIKLILSRLLFYSGGLFVYLKIKAFLGSSNGILILRYHRIFDDNDQERFYKLGINKTNFDKQMHYLKRNYHILRMEEAVRILEDNEAILPGYIVITFDDGYKDNWLNAYPVLVKYNIPAAIYLTTEYIGTSRLLPWDRLRYIVSHSELPQIKIPMFKSKTFDISTHRRRVESFYQLKACLKEVDEEVKNQIINDLETQLVNGYPEESKRDMFLSWDDVKKMSENNISFGGHTLTHPLMTRVSLEEARTQINKSKQDIEARLDSQVTTFAYPGGVFNEEIKAIVQQSGYKSACSTVLGTNNHNADLYALKRKGVSDGVSTGLTGKFSKALFAVEVSGIFDKIFFRTKFK